MQSPDHPELAYVQAAGYTKGRPDGPPLWIVVHDMEAGEHSTRAENTAAYFANPGDGRQVSSHYCADDNSVVQCVRLGDTAWTVGNRPGNNRGINWEFSGYARQTRAEWLDPFGLAMFRQAAPIIRADAAKFGIPLRRCTVDDLKAFRPGVTSHNDLRLAFGGTTHTDPGPSFPWDTFISILLGEDMSKAELLDALDEEVQYVSKGVAESAKETGWRATNSVRSMLESLFEAMILKPQPPLELTDAQLDALADKVAARLSAVRFVAESDAG